MVMPAVPDSACPYEVCVDTLMSNFDHAIESGAEELLEGDVFGLHAAWNFNARIWKDKASRLYKSEVWRYHSPVAVVEASTLKGLMSAVNAEYGWE